MHNAGRHIIAKARFAAVLVSYALIVLACAPIAAGADSGEHPWPNTPIKSPVVSPAGDGIPGGSSGWFDTTRCLPEPWTPFRAWLDKRTVARPVYPPAAARSNGDTKVYVALGDSFAAGEGAPTEVKDNCGDPHQLFIAGTSDPGNHCHRSPNAYPVRLFEQLERSEQGWSLDHRACSGATTVNFREEQKGFAFEDVDSSRPGNPPQLAQPASNYADLVTITMGGNDAHFAKIVSGCLIAASLSDLQQPIIGPRLPTVTFMQDGMCKDKWQPPVVDALADLPGQLESAVEQAQGMLRPNGRIILVGYPKPFPENVDWWCGLGVGKALISPSSMNWLNRVVANINRRIEDVARKTGVSYVDVSTVLQNGRHDACTDGDQRWINRTIIGQRDWSWHPKAPAHARQADMIKACFVNPGPRTCRVPPRSPTHEEEWPIAIGALPMDGSALYEPYIQYAFYNMGCDAEAGGPGAGVLVNDAVFGDATADGIKDAVVAMECNPSTSGWPETVLVLDGANGPQRATIAGVLIDGTQTPTRLDATDFAINNGTITVSGNDYRKGGPEPTSTFARTFTWSGSEFIDVSTEQGSACPPTAAEAIGDSTVLVESFETSRAFISICSDTSGSLYYHGLTGVGEIVLIAQNLGGSTYQAINTEGGSTYVYTVSPDELLVTRDGRVLSRQSVIG